MRTLPALPPLPRSPSSFFLSPLYCIIFPAKSTKGSETTSDTRCFVVKGKVPDKPFLGQPKRFNEHFRNPVERRLFLYLLVLFGF